MDQPDEKPRSAAPEPKPTDDAKRGKRLTHLLGTMKGRETYRGSKAPKRQKPSLPKLPWNDS